MSESKEDVCRCGDYRRSHDANGFCRVCVWANPQRPCTEFRIDIFTVKSRHIPIATQIVQTELSAATLRIERLEKALKFIIEHHDKTIVSMDVATDNQLAYKLGANRAFNQMAKIAEDGLRDNTL